MTATEVLRKEVKQYIDKADDKALKKVRAIFESDFEGAKENEEEDWWDELPTYMQTQLENAIKEGEEGKGTPHSEMVEKYSKWLKK